MPGPDPDAPRSGSGPTSALWAAVAGRSRGQFDLAFSSLRIPSYRRYSGANFVSVAGSWMQRVGQDWLVLELTESAVALGITLAMQFLPILLGAVWAGGVVDRSDLRRVLAWTQVLMAGLAIGLGVLALTGSAQLWMVWCFAAALGVVEMFDNPARHKLISTLVPTEEVANAVAINSASHNLGGLVGPSVAGLVIAVSSVGVAFLLNALSFVPMFLVVRRLAEGGRDVVEPDAGEVGPAAPVGTLAYVRSEPVVLRSLVLLMVLSIFSRNFRVLLPLLVIERFGGGAGGYGTLLACMGAGALLGGIGAARASTPTMARLLTAGVWYAGLVLLIAPTGSFLQLALVLVCVGGVNTFFNVTARSLELLGSAPSYRARVMSAHQVVFVGTAPIGALLLGVVAEFISPGAGFVLAGAVVLVTCVWSIALGHRVTPER